MELKKTKYNKEYIMINIIKNKIKVKTETGYEDKYAYTFIGIDLLGNRQILSMNIEKDDARFFLNIFESLKGKGITKIYFLVTPLEERIIRGIKISFEQTILIESLTMCIQKLWKWVTFQSRSQLIKKLKGIYVQDNFQKSIEFMNYFQEEYGDNEILLKLFTKSFNHIERYYQYDKIVREFLFNHSSFTKIYDEINKLSNTMIFDNTEMFAHEVASKISVIEINKLYNKKSWLNIIVHCSKYIPELTDKVAELI